MLKPHLSITGPNQKHNLRKSLQAVLKQVKEGLDILAGQNQCLSLFGTLCQPCNSWLLLSALQNYVEGWYVLIVSLYVQFPKHCYNWRSHKANYFQLDMSDCHNGKALLNIVMFWQYLHFCSTSDIVGAHKHKYGDGDGLLSESLTSFVVIPLFTSVVRKIHVAKFPCWVDFICSASLIFYP